MPASSPFLRRPPFRIPPLWIGWLAALCAALIGSGWQIASRHGVTTTLGPVELAVMRYAVPALLLLPLWWRQGAWPAGLSRRPVAQALRAAHGVWRPALWAGGAGRCAMGARCAHGHVCGGEFAHLHRPGVAG